MQQAEIRTRPVVGAIVVVSGLAVSFLLWLLYVHHASADFAGRWMFLPALNALLNGLCAIALCAGLYFIKHQNREAHRTSMLLAFAFSFAFLISYIVNHALHGDTIFPGHGPIDCRGHKRLQLGAARSRRDSLSRKEAIVDLSTL